MINAKEELLIKLGDHGYTIDDIDAFNVGFVENYENDLCKGTDVETLLSFLDQNYYAGYGSQSLLGIVLLKNGLHLYRSEYDGSEWWSITEHYTVEELLDIDLFTLNLNSKIYKGPSRFP